MTHTGLNVHFENGGLDSDEEVREFTISLRNPDDALKATNNIRDAITIISAVRSLLGSYQNRLEHTLHSLSTTRENLQAAESTIRDTDMAEEAMRHTKNSILAQSAQFMLSQANQQPQYVMRMMQ